MKYPRIDQFHLNGEYFEEIYPNLWLMDDHRWSYYIWERFFHRNPGRLPLALIHADQHWDGINDFLKPSDEATLRSIRTIEEIFALVSGASLVRKDSFIAPAIIRGIINEVHFYCSQTDTEPGLDKPLLKKHNSKQFIHRKLNSIIERLPKGSLFDLDLDLFNRSEMWEEGNLWENKEIVHFLDTCSGIIRSSCLVTIAMSFGDSGSREDTKYLTELVVPRVIELMS
jgi:hypothetical protein